MWLGMLQFWEVVPCGRHTPSVTFLLLKVSHSPSPLHKVIHECGEIIGMQRARSRETEEAWKTLVRVCLSGVNEKKRMKILWLEINVTNADHTYCIKNLLYSHYAVNCRRSVEIKAKADIWGRQGQSSSQWAFCAVFVMIPCIGHDIQVAWKTALKPNIQ